VEIGPNIEFSLKPLLRRRLRSNDAAAHKYLTFRAGYRYIVTTDKPSEHRVLLEATPRFPLPWALLLSDRHGAELRVIERQFSWRYRNRLSLERSFHVKRMPVTPFVRGEIFYDSRFERWNQNSYSVGASFPVRQRLDLAPFYEHRNTSRSSPAHVNALGLTVSLYFRGERKPK